MPLTTQGKIYKGELLPIIRGNNYEEFIKMILDKSLYKIKHKDKTTYFKTLDDMRSAAKRETPTEIRIYKFDRHAGVFLEICTSCFDHAPINHHLFCKG